MNMGACMGPCGPQVLSVPGRLNVRQAEAFTWTGTQGFCYKLKFWAEECCVILLQGGLPKGKIQCQSDGRN